MESQSKMIKKLCETYGYKEYMIKRYLKLFGKDQIKDFLEGNEQKLLPSIKVNTLKISKEALNKKLADKGFELEPIPSIPDAYYIRKAPFSIGATTEYLLGYYYIQRIASMIPLLILNVTSQDIVVDMCAAPGGKTIQIAQAMNNQGVILALDLNRQRMKSLRSNISRCGVKNVIAIRMDAADLDELHIKNISKILIDAPCSGSGLIPVDSKRKTSRIYEDITFCASIQMKLIKTAINSLEQGGELVYSTCSIEPEENEYIIEAALKQGNIEVIDLDIQLGEPGLTEVFGRKLSPHLKKAKRFYPFLQKTIGFFICKLKKV
ncbi:MAG: RsmB/NOP family class I SAM-dependent RNA methyltransferase [Promethearchaeota archaeon]